MRDGKPVDELADWEQEQARWEHGISAVLGFAVWIVVDALAETVDGIVCLASSLDADDKASGDGDVVERGCRVVLTVDVAPGGVESGDCHVVEAEEEGHVEGEELDYGLRAEKDEGAGDVIAYEPRKGSGKAIEGALFLR